MPTFVAGVPKSADLDATLAMHGMDRFAARKAIVARLEEKGLIEKIEPQSHVVPHGDRSNVVIEPFLTDQWYVNAKELAKPAIAAVREGQDQIRPEELGEDLFRLDGEHPALVHLAPALVGPPNSGVVRAGWQGVRRERREAEAQKRGRQALRQRRPTLTRDEDVLDTWFSSALWPFSTLGWPDKTPELDALLPDVDVWSPASTSSSSGSRA